MGGTGRTTVTIALAAALVAKGRRVLIVDGTEFGTFEVCETLREWQDMLQENDLPGDALEIETFDEHAYLEDLFTRAQRREIDIALIDTSNRLGDRLMARLAMADLILVPFLGLLEARYALSRGELPADFRSPL